MATKITQPYHTVLAQATKLHTLQLASKLLDTYIYAHYLKYITKGHV